MFSKIWTKQSTKESFNKIEQLKEKIEEADTIIIGPGPGLFYFSRIHLYRRPIHKIFL